MGNASSQTTKRKVADEPESSESKLRRLNPPQSQLKRTLSNHESDISSKKSRLNDQEVPFNGAIDWEDSLSQDSESYRSDNSSNDGQQVPSRFGSRNSSRESLNDVPMTELTSINKRNSNWIDVDDQRSKRLRRNVENYKPKSLDSLTNGKEMNWNTPSLKRRNSYDDLTNKRLASGINTPSSPLERLQRLKRHRSNSDDFEVDPKRLKRSAMIDRKRKVLYDEDSPRKRLRSYI